MSIFVRCSNVFSSVDAPVCTHPSPQVLGAQIEEELRVRCSVTANPPDVTFFWQFNNSGESLDVSPLKFGKYQNYSYKQLEKKNPEKVNFSELFCKKCNLTKLHINIFHVNHYLFQETGSVQKLHPKKSDILQPPMGPLNGLYISLHAIIKLL